MKLLFTLAPSQEVIDRYFSNTPTSMAYAVSLLINEIDSGRLEAEYYPKIISFGIVKPDTWVNYEDIFTEFKPDIILVSSTYPVFRTFLRHPHNLL